MRPMFAVSLFHFLTTSFVHLPRSGAYHHHYRQAFVPHTSVTFVSKASVETGVAASYNLRKRIEVVKDCRNIGKKDMKYNDAMPKMKVDPETYVSVLPTSD